MKNTWIVVGCSSSAPKTLPKAMEAYPGSTTITTNAGVKLFTPDLYFINEVTAARLFLDEIHTAQAAGAAVIVPVKYGDAIREQNVIPDELFKMDSDAIHDHYIPGKINQCKFSGHFTVQIALYRGADQLVMVGHGGYDKGDNDYFYPPVTPHSLRKSERYTRDFLQPYWQSIIDSRPDVEFVFYGRPLYVIAGDNVRIVDA